MNHSFPHNTLNSSRCRGPIVGSTGDVRLSCGLLMARMLKGWSVKDSGFDLTKSLKTASPLNFKGLDLNNINFNNIDFKNAYKRANRITGNAILT